MCMTDIKPLSKRTDIISIKNEDSRDWFLKVITEKENSLSYYTSKINPVYSINGDSKGEPSGNEAETPQINMLDWKNVIEDKRKEFSETVELKKTIGINPNRFNQRLSMICQFHDRSFDSCYHSTVLEYNASNFAKVAMAYGLSLFLIKNESEIGVGGEKLWENQAEPFLMNGSIDSHTNVYPKIMFGSSITEM